MKTKRPCVGKYNELTQTWYPKNTLHHEMQEWLDLALVIRKQIDRNSYIRMW